MCLHIGEWPREKTPSLLPLARSRTMSALPCRLSHLRSGRLRVCCVSRAVPSVPIRRIRAEALHDLPSKRRGPNESRWLKHSNRCRLSYQLSTAMLVFEKQKVDMSRHSIYEYGILHQIGSNYTFSFAGSQTGETFTFTLYDARQCCNFEISNTGRVVR